MTIETTNQADPNSAVTGGFRAIWTSIGYVLTFSAAATAVGVLIAFATDDKGLARYRPWISEKLAVLSARPPTPNAIFVGASVTLRSIVPVEVDAAAAAAGCPDIRAINLGMPGARLFESAFMIDKVLETPDLKPGAIVIFDARSADTLDFFDIAASDRRPVTARLRYVSDVITSSQWSWSHLTQVVTYTRAALGEALGFHSLSDAAMQRWRESDKFDPLRVVNRGYVSLETEKGNERTEFPDRAQKRQLMRLQKWNTKRYLKDPSSIPINPFADRIKAAGFVPVAYAAPWRRGELAAAVELAKMNDPSFLAIAITPDTAPDIFASADLWYDIGHVTEAGAKYVSSIVGRDLCLVTKNLRPRGNETG